MPSISQWLIQPSRVHWYPGRHQENNLFSGHIPDQRSRIYTSVRNMFLIPKGQLMKPKYSIFAIGAITDMLQQEILYVYIFYVYLQILKFGVTYQN